MKATVSRATNEEQTRRRKKRRTATVSEATVVAKAYIV